MQQSSNLLTGHYPSQECASNVHDAPDLGMMSETSHELSARFRTRTSEQRFSAIDKIFDTFMKLGTLVN
jgi:hypothetical protein